MPQAERVIESTRIQLCGKLSVEVKGVQLADALRGRQVRLLLAYLVLNRARQVGREELIDALWPYQPPRSEDAALRTLLSRLRSAVGADSVAGRDGLMLTLPEPVWVDVEAAGAEVQRALQALARGDARSAWALAQVPFNIASRGLLPGAEARWLEAPRRELEDVRLQALEVIGRAGLSLGGGQLASVERAARSLIETEPYRESGYVLLMEALAGEGNLAEGLRVFERLRSLLRDELGVSPSPEALAVHERLLSPPGAVGAGGAAAGGPGEGVALPLPPELEARGDAPLVGRRHELNELERLWGAAGGGPSSAPVAADPSAPVTSGPSAPVTSGPSAPVTSDPSAPVTSDPSAPVTSDPSAPVTSDPSAPVTSDPSAPVTSDPSPALDGAMPSGRIAMLTGDPGVGKTRLAAELARRAYDQGGCVLAGRSPEETVTPYQPFLEALRHYFLNAPAAELRVTVREYGPELTRLVPDLRRRLPDLPAAIEGEPETERYRLFEAVVGLLSAIARSAPILLVLDDLHWADRPSLLLLRHLARAPNPRRLLILGAYRGTEVEREGFPEALADLRRERLVTEISIGGLSVDETAELVVARTHEQPAAGFAEALHELTEGNPLFIEETLRQLVEAGVHVSEAVPSLLGRFGLPEGVKEVIARRLARLGPRTTEWLRVAAVIGRDFDVSLLERVVSLDEDEFLDALDEALGAGLVAEIGSAPDRYSFSHALIRETLYEGMSAPRRARTHRRVGEALEAARKESLPSLALHFTRAAGRNDTDKAISYAMRAAEQATAMLAHEEAAEHYARALEVIERFEPDALERRCELLLLIGEARVRSGERVLAWPAFREAARLAEVLGDAERLARAAVGASRGYIQQPGITDHELIAMLERALKLNAGARTLMRVKLLSRMCGALYYTAERDRMGDLADEAGAIADDLDDAEARAYACVARRRALWDAAHLRERLATSTEMLTRAREIGNLELELQAHAWLVVDLLEAGDRDAVDAQIEAFTDGAERLRQPLYLWNVLVWRAMRALLGGALERAEVFASEALAAGASAEAVTAPQYYAIQLLALRREQDRMSELEAPARSMVDAQPDRPAWRAGLSALLAEGGRLDEARAHLDVLAARRFEDVPRDGDWMTAIALASEAAVAIGDAERAALLYQMLQPYADRNVVIGLAAVCLGSASQSLGKLALVAGEPERGRQHFEQALRADRILKAPVALAHTQLDYARLLGPSRRATELIAAAAKTAQQLGLPAVARRAAELGRR